MQLRERTHECGARVSPFSGQAIVRQIHVRIECDITNQRTDRIRSIARDECFLRELEGDLPRHQGRGITSLSALPETWLGLLLQQAEKDPDVTLIQVAKEEEAIGIAAGAYFAGERHVLLMQNHGFLAAINGIVSLAQLYGIPLCMLIALRGHWGEPYPWHTRGGIVTEGVLRALGIPFEYARDPAKVGHQIREAYTFSQSALSPVALLLTRDLMEDAL